MGLLLYCTIHAMYKVSKWLNNQAKITGDQSFTDCIDGKSSAPLWFTYGNWSTGDVNGNPIANNGW